MTVDTYHSKGILYGQSVARIVAGGTIGSWLWANDSSTIEVCGGTVDFVLDAYDSSTVAVAAGSVMSMQLFDTSVAYLRGGYVFSLGGSNLSTVEITDGSVHMANFADGSVMQVAGGSVYRVGLNPGSAMHISAGAVEEVYTSAGCTVSLTGGRLDWLDIGGTAHISGGTLGNLSADLSSVVTLDGRDFVLGEGLSLAGSRVLGAGVLSGRWFDGSQWTMNIVENSPDATIRIVPEPATLALLALGGTMLTRRRARK